MAAKRRPPAPTFRSTLDGRSLLPHLQQRGGHDEVAAEYLGEGALGPIVMLRQGDYKFVHAAADPDQLYHLPSDPDELRNLAQDAGSVEVLQGFRAEVASRWNLPQLHEQVVASQVRRRFIGAANMLGAHQRLGLSAAARRQPPLYPQSPGPRCAGSTRPFSCPATERRMKRLFLAALLCTA